MAPHGCETCRPLVEAMEDQITNLHAEAGAHIRQLQEELALAGDELERAERRARGFEEAWLAEERLATELEHKLAEARAELRRVGSDRAWR